ncbi:MAG: YbjN domain-containing protein [Pseudomonadota bacterium]
MFVQSLTSRPSLCDPLDAVESYAARRDIPVRRVRDGEVHLGVDAAWNDFTLWFVWRPELETMQVGASLALTAEPEDVEALSRLIVLANENIWVGHFDLWSDDGAIVYRHGVVLPESASFEPDQVDVLVRYAVQAYERFYPAFTYVIGSGEPAEAALEAVMFETAGTA